MWVYVCVVLFICVCLFLVSARAPTFTLAFFFAHLYLCACVYVCVCMWVYVCVFLFICVCFFLVSARAPTLPADAAGNISPFGFLEGSELPPYQIDHEDSIQHTGYRAVCDAHTEAFDDMTIGFLMFMWGEIVKVNYDMSMAKVNTSERATPSKGPGNICCETPFGLLDFLRSRCQEYSLLKTNTICMAKNNNTIRHYMAMPPEEFTVLFKKAMPPEEFTVLFFHITEQYREHTCVCISREMIGYTATHIKVYHDNRHANYANLRDLIRCN